MAKEGFDVLVVGVGVGGVNAALAAKKAAGEKVSVGLLSFRPLTYPRPDLAGFLKNP